MRVVCDETSQASHYFLAFLDVADERCDRKPNFLVQKFFVGVLAHNGSVQRRVSAQKRIAKVHRQFYVVFVREAGGDGAVPPVNDLDDFFYRSFAVENFVCYRDMVRQALRLLRDQEVDFFARVLNSEELQYLVIVADYVLGNVTA